MEKLITLLPETLTETLMAVLGSLIHNWIPLSLAIIIAAILKVYVDTEKLKTLLLRKSNVSILAFMITGQGTSAWVIAGIATFMKKRVLSLYILFILGWGILLGYAYDLLLAMGI